MKRKGFTLAEVLIALLVVGIVAALVTPTISKIMPNREKILVIKAYKTLHETTSMLLTEPSFYLNGTTKGLEDKKECADPDFQGAPYSDNNKFCNLLMKNMNNFSENRATSGKADWVTADFMAWTCQYKSSNNTASIIVDINAEEKPNCSYNASNCKLPDQYLFTVETDGNIVANDKLTKVYLNSLERLNDKKADYNEL